MHETLEVPGATRTAHTPVGRRSLRRATTKVHEGTFEGTSWGIEAEEADDDFMPIRQEDGSPLDDGEKGIVAKRSRQGHSAIKSFDQH